MSTRARWILTAVIVVVAVVVWILTPDAPDPFTIRYPW